ncbi:DEAD/DEAH box helicase [Falsarthrobacter nasiphocae]|uniref:Superfamily II DNA or RNA helicase n=1 Tax=Falsarthrobacter nasiphocae TaxID=189863 RepID=A0AAE3YEH1_9MICC|nr:DEAD/DEAH box helicase [Falsarthrobacter nasiphocae]MDR6891720.1 superfamily II DNA or RNA helicase [Falsarthrobacter nasiphocae]
MTARLPLVDAREILSALGGVAFTRGRALANDEHIPAIEFDPDTATVRAEVHDDDGAHSLTITLSAEGSRGAGDWTIEDFGEDESPEAKIRAAAALIRSNALHKEFEETEAPSKSSAFAHLAPSWRTELTHLVTGGRSGESRVEPDTRLALQFEVHDANISSTRRLSTQPEQRSANSRPRLGIRPVIMKDNGRVTRGSLRWNSISFKTYGHHFEPRQHRWFAQLVPLYRANGQLHFGEDNEWIYLDDFTSPLIWPLLEEAAKLGIAFVGTRKNAHITLGSHGWVELDASLDDEALALRPTAEIDGRRWPAATSGVVFRHGVYTIDGEHILLAPSPRPITDAAARALTDGRTYRVPAEDVSNFVREDFPRLGRVVPIVSTDESFDVPDLAPPRLEVHVAYSAKRSAEIDFRFVYGEGDGAQSFAADSDPAPDDDSSRDRIAEQEISQEALRAYPLGDLGPAVFKGLALMDLVRVALPRLRAVPDVVVLTEGPEPAFHELVEDPRLMLTTVESSDRDWFNLGLLIRVGEHSIPLADILRALTNGQSRMLLPNGSGTYISLEQPLFSKLRELVDEASHLTDKEGTISITKYQVDFWDELCQLAAESIESTAWKNAVAGLLTLDKADPAPVPEGLNATLRNYQVEGYSWLDFIRSHSLGGILADDMGLGKTLQSLAMIVAARNAVFGVDGGAGAEDSQAARDPRSARPFLVVAPTSVGPNWQAEAARFAPGLRVIHVRDTEKKAGTRLADTIEGADIVITSYTLLRLDAEAYSALPWAGLLLDEAQFVKNRKTKAHQAAAELDAPFKLAITGTPMENNLLDLYSIFSIVSPGLFSSATRFTDQYARPIERGDSPEVLRRLRKRIRPFMLRRTKDAVVTDLPPKQEQVLGVDLSAKHRKVYDTHLQRERQKVLQLVTDMDKNRFTVFQSLTLLRQMSLDPALVSEEYEEVGSAKLDVLLEQLEDVIAEGHKALVFSQFTSFLKRAAARLEAAGIPYAYLDGATRDRAAAVNEFKDGKAPVFLISLKAGGFGLNLTEADYCYLLDPWWNPAAEAQAVDRTHRIGQTRNVMVYRLVARDTIEEKVVALQEAKRKLVSAVMSEGEDAFGSKLTAEDIRELIS